MSLTVEQAIHNLKIAAANTVANLEQHKALQASLDLVEKELNKLKFLDKSDENELAGPPVKKEN